VSRVENNINKDFGIHKDCGLPIDFFCIGLLLFQDI